MEETKIVSPQIKGLIISLIMIILGLGAYFTGLAFTTWYQWAANGIMIIAVIIACLHFANQKQGYVTFGNVFFHGFMTSLVIAVIMLVYTLLAFTVLFPDMKEKIFDMQIKAMEDKGMDSDKIEQSMGFVKKYFMAFLIFGVILGTLFWGCIASLLGGAFAKKKPINPLNQGGM